MEVLAYIKAGGYKGIGFDVIGLDPIADANLTRHKELFRDTDIVNIENLKNLEQCGDDLFWFSCFPLKLDTIKEIRPPACAGGLLSAFRPRIGLSDICQAQQIIHAGIMNFCKGNQCLRRNHPLTQLIIAVYLLRALQLFCNCGLGHV